MSGRPQTSLIGVIIMNKANKFYPEANECMWNECIFLGKFTDEDGDNYDLGIYIRDGRSTSAAIVYGPNAEDYLSGPLVVFAAADDRYAETMRRALAAGYSI